MELLYAFLLLNIEELGALDFVKGTPARRNEDDITSCNSSITSLAFQVAHAIIDSTRICVCICNVCAAIEDRELSANEAISTAVFAVCRLSLK